MTWSLPALLVAGVAWWTLLEYLLHRFAFHADVSFLGRRHRGHHENALDPRLARAAGPAVALGLGLHAAVLLPLLGPGRGAAALAGVAAGYGFYEWVHAAVHRPHPRSAWLRRLRRHHLLHHHAEPDARFGVTTTLWDRVLGTRGRPAPAARDIGAAPPIPRGLGRRQARVARAVAEALLADRAGPPPADRIDAVIAKLSLVTAAAGMQTRLALRAALVVVQATPLLYLLRLRRFTGASLGARAACLARLEAGRLGILAVLLKLTVSIAYFEQPAALAETGFRPGEVLARAEGAGAPGPLPAAAEDRP